MVTAEADICNRALARIGQKNELISDLATDQTETAALCNVFYPQCRDELLASFPWPFATKHQVLALLTTTRSGWACAYAAPEDMVQAQYIYPGFRRGAPIAQGPFGVRGGFSSAQLPLGGISSTIAYAMEASDDGTSRIILTDQSSAELIYTAQIIAVVAFPPLFVDCLAWKMASELALALPIKAQLADMASKKYELSFARAGAQAFRESTEDIQPDSETIAARG